MPDTTLPEPSSTTRSKGRATSNDSSAPANGEAAAVRKVHFVLQGKGGVGKTFVASLLDFIEKHAASSPRLDVKDCFLAEDLVGSFEGEPERPEISEGAPASPHLGPVEQFEAI